MRVVGLPGAVLLGLGSILGTGVFVSLGLAAGVAGDSIVLAVVLAAGVAACNGLSSAQLAASHPVSGGTYEYGYRYLTPALGFTAGWMFLCAKSASAATAALGFAGYALEELGVAGTGARVLVALGAVVALTLLVASGLHRSNRANAVVVAFTLVTLGTLIVAGLPTALDRGAVGAGSAVPAADPGLRGLLHGTALVFVAYTGYGRIATLGEEVHDPRRSIPRAIVITLLVTLLLYAAVAFVSVRVLGATSLAEATRSSAAPLEAVAHALGRPGVARVVAAGAIAAMLGVLLNLVLGLSRVLLAMARRADLPRGLARLEGTPPSPRRAVLAVGAIVAGLTLTGSVALNWSFSAFTVLVYYALTNLAALRLPPEARLYPRWISVLGLAACLGLAFWVEPAVWLTGLALIALGLLGHALARRRTGSGAAP